MTPLPAPPARHRRLDACDAPTGIVTTIRDTVSCSWIFYSECHQRVCADSEETSHPLRDSEPTSPFAASRSTHVTDRPSIIVDAAHFLLRRENDPSLLYTTLARTGSNASGGGPSETAAPPPAQPDPDLDSMHMMLDPHLRPISPDLTNDESKRIFEEHKQLAQEYLKIQTELAYLSNHKSELEAQMDEDVLRQKREVIQLENEKDSLNELYCSLKKQLARAENESWFHPEEMPNE